MKDVGTQQLETERLILRRFELNDADDMYNNWATDPNVTKYVTWEPHKNVQDTSSLISMWVETYEKPHTYRWVVQIKDTGDIIGSIDVVKMSDLNKIGEIGYCYGSKWWGKGYGTEALKAVIGYLFTEADFEVLEAEHLKANPASGKVMAKAGMIYEATLRGRFINKLTGEREDLVVYSITRDEYNNSI